MSSLSTVANQVRVAADWSTAVDILLTELKVPNSQSAYDLLIILYIYTNSIINT